MSESLGQLRPPARWPALVAGVVTVGCLVGITQLGRVDHFRPLVAGILMVLLALSLVALGVAWGNWRALLVVATIFALPLLTVDFLDAAGVISVCDPDRCDPKVPASTMLLFLPPILGLVALGILYRKRRGTPPLGGQDPEVAGGHT